MTERAELISFPGLQEGLILGRKSLFTVEILVNSTKVMAYLNNTGRLKGIIETGKKCYCIKNKKSSKTPIRIIGVEEDGLASVVDTSIQEQAFIIAQRRNLISWLKDCIYIGKNQVVNGAVIDYIFNCSGKITLVEIKSAVMRLPGNLAGYPDAPTSRGRKQIQALIKQVKKGVVGFIVFIAGIPGSLGFQLYCEEDQLIGRIIYEASQRGVLFKALSMYLDPRRESIVLENSDLPLNLECR
ncbi:MAG: DNA/RNA nuclease SfsA [Desulfurococcaceae archaeon]